jgi:hypothetical protein
MAADETLKLQYLIVTRDAEIAALKQALVVAHLRIATGASAQATFDPQSLTFTEPTPAPSES